jgi:hypothetical protein
MGTGRGEPCGGFELCVSRFVPGSDRQCWRTELELSSSKSSADRHRSATLGAKPKRVRFLGGGGFRFYLGWNCA